MKEFNQTQTAVGVLTIGTERFEGVRCHIDSNPLDTSELGAVLYSNYGDQSLHMMMAVNPNVLSFEAQHGRYLFRWEGRFSSSIMQEKHDEFARVSLTSFGDTSLSSGGLPTDASFTFLISDSLLFRRRVMRVQHAQHGLMFGWSGSDKDPNWKNDDLELKESGWEIRISRIVLFKESASDEAAILVKENVAIRLSLVQPEIDIDVAFEEAKIKATSYLRMLSLLEGRSINWTSCKIKLYHEMDALVDSTQYQHVSKKAYGLDHFVVQATERFREVLQSMALAYRGLPMDRRPFIDRLIDNYILLGDSEIFLDTRLTLAQTTLEMAVATIPNALSERGFSRKLVIALEHLQVEWADLFEYVTREQIFSDTEKANMKMVDFRNALLHDGDLLDGRTGFELYEELERVKRLLRRLISKLIGCDLPSIEYRKPSITITRTAPTKITIPASQGAEARPQSTLLQSDDQEGNGSNSPETGTICQV